MKKKYNKINSFVRRYCYIIDPIIISLIILLCCSFEILRIEVLVNKQELMADISGTLAGFLFAMIAILQILDPNTSRFAKAFLESEHPKILFRTIILGIVLCLLCVTVYIFCINVIIILLVFSSAIVECFIAAWYMYKIIKNIY